MAYKVFIDVNILVDLADKNRSEHKTALLLFEKISQRNVLGYISESVVNTTFYLTRKLTSTENFRLFMQDLLTIIKILSCTNASISQAYKSTGNDLEDAVLYQIALENKMDFFITNNIKDFKKIQHPSLQVVTAKQLLEIV